VKNPCVMFVFAIVYFLLFSEYQFAVDIVQGYNLQYLQNIWQGMHFRNCGVV
jgi:hypothetical protein